MLFGSQSALSTGQDCRFPGARATANGSRGLMRMYFSGRHKGTHVLKLFIEDTYLEGP